MFCYSSINFLFLGKPNFNNINLQIMKKEWIKPSIIDFSNSSVNSGTDAETEPETIIMCFNGMELATMSLTGFGSSTT